MGACRQGPWRGRLSSADDHPQYLLPRRDGLCRPPPQWSQYRQDGLPRPNQLDRRLIGARPRCPSRGAASRRPNKSLVARSYWAVSPRAFATTRAPVMVDSTSAALLGESPSATSLSWHILKKPFTSFATGSGRSCEAAPSTVQGHMRALEKAVPRKAFVQTRIGFGSFSSSLSTNSEVYSAQRRTTAAARSSFVGKW